MRAISRLAFVGVLLVAAPAWTQEPDEPPADSLSSQARIAPADEPGEPLVISGQVFDADGLHAVPNIVVYAYHTDIKGLYTPSGAARPPRLRGWARTDGEGRYEGKRGARPPQDSSPRFATQDEGNGTGKHPEIHETHESGVSVPTVGQLVKGHYHQSSTGPESDCASDQPPEHVSLAYMIPREPSGVPVQLVRRTLSIPNWDIEYPRPRINAIPELG